MDIGSRTGLVLEGGGMRAIFTVGVLDCFMDHDIWFPYTIGVSAGASNGISYASRQRGRSRFSNIDLLEKYDYPELAEQKEQHKLFIAKIEEFKEDFRNNHFMLHFNMAIFLKTWISNHIEVLDKKYSQFLNDRGVF